MRIDTIPEGALLMYDNNQQSALGVKNCKVNIYVVIKTIMAASKETALVNSFRIFLSFIICLIL